MKAFLIAYAITMSGLILYVGFCHGLFKCLRLKRTIRRWLGLEEIFMGVDIGIHDPSCIIIVSKQKGGVIRIIDSHFPSLQDVERFTEECKSRYGIPEKSVIRDYPRGAGGKKAKGKPY